MSWSKISPVIELMSPLVWEEIRTSPKNRAISIRVSTGSLIVEGEEPVEIRAVKLECAQVTECFSLDAWVVVDVVERVPAHCVGLQRLCGGVESCCYFVPVVRIDLVLCVPLINELSQVAFIVICFYLVDAAVEGRVAGFAECLCGEDRRSLMRLARVPFLAKRVSVDA